MYVEILNDFCRLQESDPELHHVKESLVECCKQLLLEQNIFNVDYSLKPDDDGFIESETGLMFWPQELEFKPLAQYKKNELQKFTKV